MSALEGCYSDAARAAHRCLTLCHWSGQSAAGALWPGAGRELPWTWCVPAARTGFFLCVRFTFSFFHHIASSSHSSSIYLPVDPHVMAYLHSQFQKLPGPPSAASRMTDWWLLAAFWLLDSQFWVQLPHLFKGLLLVLGSVWPGEGSGVGTGPVWGRNGGAWRDCWGRSDLKALPLSVWDSWGSVMPWWPFAGLRPQEPETPPKGIWQDNIIVLYPLCAESF